MSGNVEKELCFYCEIKNPQGLGEAQAVETHEQYEYRLPPLEDGTKRGRVRVRKTDKNGEVSYTETIKLPIDQTGLGDVEAHAEITEQYFKAWKILYKPKGHHKVRYTFISNKVNLKLNGELLTIPSVKLEFDIFINSQGKRSKWAKVDIEVQEIIKHLKESYPEFDTAKFEIDFSSFPMEIGRVVSAVTEDEEEKAAIEHFYKTYAIDS